MSSMEAARGLTDEAFERSVDLLRRNATPQGFVASGERHGPNYYAVWGRDGSICAIGALFSGDETVRQAGVTTLHNLARNQAENGQIPSYMLLDETDEITDVVYGGLGNVTTIDSNLWFLVAAQTAFSKAHRSEFINDDFMTVYQRVFRHLRSLDSDSCGLLEIPVAGDWSDILDRSYHVLYDEVLWYRALKCAAILSRQRKRTADADDFERRAAIVERRLNSQFWWTPEAMRGCIEQYFLANPIPTDEELPWYQSHLKPFCNHWYHRFDAFANVLAGLMGIAPPERIEQILKRIDERGLTRHHPLQVLDPVIEEGDADWDQVYAKKEPAYAYHNGGIWPFAGAFWVVLLARQGHAEQAERALGQLAGSLRAAADDEDAWAFYEYFTGDAGQPAGHRLQSWNAATYIMAYRAVYDGEYACFSKLET